MRATRSCRDRCPERFDLAAQLVSLLAVGLEAEAGGQHGRGAAVAEMHHIVVFTGAKQDVPVSAGANDLLFAGQ